MLGHISVAEWHELACHTYELPLKKHYVFLEVLVICVPIEYLYNKRYFKVYIINTL